MECCAASAEIKGAAFSRVASSHRNELPSPYHIPRKRKREIRFSKRAKQRASKINALRFDRFERTYKVRNVVLIISLVSHNAYDRDSE